MRVQGWEGILSDQIEAARTTPFEWGAHDCCLFAAGVVLAITGKDPMADFRGRYTSEFGALKLIKALDLSFEEYIGRDFERIPVTMARRGDGVLKHQAVGICNGIESYFVTPSGLTAVKTLECEGAWRVN